MIIIAGEKQKKTPVCVFDLESNGIIKVQGPQMFLETISSMTRFLFTDQTASTAARQKNSACAAQTSEVHVKVNGLNRESIDIGFHGCSIDMIVIYVYN